MPVGATTLVSLTAVEFIEGNCFGFVKATVQAPAGEYLGILSMKTKWPISLSHWEL